MPKQTTVSDWEKLRSVVVWTIFDKASYKAFQAKEPKLKTNSAWRKAYGAIRLNFKASNNIPDGTYIVECEGWAGTAQEKGLVVKDGHFSPANAAKVIGKAARKADKDGGGTVDHVFIESIRLKKGKKGVLLVSLGS